MSWEVVIGLEVHTQLSTKSKIFSGSATAYGASPNTQASIVDLGMPGVLPVLNQEAVHLATRFGLSVNATVANRSIFARKNYFYPDLPKGYQISQFEEPIVIGGHLDIEVDNQIKRIGITRAHLEEDAGKSLHEGYSHATGIDLNRAGTPLLEIVSEPDLRSAQEAVAYLKKLHQLVTWLDICDGNMQEGSFRCDANVSIHKPGTPLGTRAEIKNINSFRFVERAIEHEVARQIDILESGGKVIQETRLYDPDRDQTRAMRSKEEANDYRYFPDPDLLPVHISTEYIDSVRQHLPELPEVRRQRFIDELGLTEYDASLLTTTRAHADYFEALIAHQANAKLAANWLNGELAAWLNKTNCTIDTSPISAQQLAGLITRISDKTLSSKLAKEVFEALWQGAGSADDVIEARGLKQVTDTGALEKWVDDVLAAHPKQIEQYKAGQDKMLGFFVGQIMKQSQGKANPSAINALLLSRLTD